MEHVRKYNLIRESQHGFLKKRSCLTNLLEFLEFVTNYIDQGYPIDVIYLDFQKAFDKVPHKRLVSTSHYRLSLDDENKCIRYYRRGI